MSRTNIDAGLACVIAVLAGTSFGMLNGLSVAFLKLQPVVVTLSTMAAARGLTYVIAGQGMTSINLPQRAEWLGKLAYLSPAPLVLALLVAAAGSVILSRTVFGRAILAVGSNEEAARFSGIDVKRTKLAVYTITGMLCGLAGVLTTGMMYTATTDAGMGYEFEAITAVLIGGTSIMGGEATVIGSVFGILIAAVLSRGLGVLGVNDLWRMMCLGLILMASVLMEGAKRYAARRMMVLSKA